MRVGIGFDVHAFDPTRRLVLGGVEIPDASGLAGWSDADVLCHAIIDAMLGAAAIGDLGAHFPEDEVAEGTSSLDLLDRALVLIGEAGYRVSNVDATIVVQKVSIAPLRDQIEKNIAERLRLEIGAVNVKATTTDFLGSIGRGEGAAGLAVVSLVNL